MLNKLVAGAAALSVASVLVLSGCSGSSPMTPAVNPGGPAMPGISLAPNATAPIAYKGNKVGGKPEIDLFSTTAGTSGYSATFTVTQKGFTKFKYAFKAISGFTNNCPKTSSASYTTSPASGKAAKKGKYTVKATSKSVAGACLMTFTGANKKTLKVTLTFTTSGVVVGKPTR